MNLLFVFKDYKFRDKGTVGSRYHSYFLFLKISNPYFTLFSKSEIYNPRNTFAPPCSQIRNINFLNGITNSALEIRKMQLGTL
jgi:hypothetical protein